MGVMLYMLPGLAADESTLARQMALERVRVLGWIEPRDDELLDSYVRRLAANIDSRGPFLLGGVSFGGMVATELARLLRPAGVLLVASARRAADLPPYVQSMAGASSHLPDAALAAGLRSPPLAEYAFGPLFGDAALLLRRLLGNTPVRLLRWQLRALASWAGNGDLPCPLRLLQGRLDRMLPPRLVRPDAVIEGAGHLVNVTHSAAVNRWIETEAALMDGSQGRCVTQRSSTLTENP